MAVLYSDLGDTLAHATGKPEFSAPIPGVATQYVLTQPFMQPLANFTPLAMNTAHPDYATYYLVEESPLEDLGGGMVKWKRTYAQVPSIHYLWSTYGYNFIGWETDFVNQIPSRERIVRTVRCKIAFEYSLTTGGAAADNFAVIPMTRYVLSANPTIQVEKIVPSSGYLFTSLPSLEIYRGWITTDLAPSSYSLVAEDSTIEQWKGNIYRRITKYVKAA